MATLVKYQHRPNETGRTDELKRVKIIFISLCLVSFLAGCTHYKNDLAREGKVAVEVISPKVMVKISDVRVLKKENGAEVVGYVRRTGLGIMHGHMDIAIFSPEDTVLGMASTSYSPNFQRLYVRRREARPSFFLATFPDILAAGTLIRVAFHPEKLGGALSCVNNQALQGISLNA